MQEEIKNVIDLSCPNCGEHISEIKVIEYCLDRNDKIKKVLPCQLPSKEEIKKIIQRLNGVEYKYGYKAVEEVATAIYERIKK